MGRSTPEKDQTLGRQIGICLGLGLSEEKSAELIGVVVNTVRAHRQRQADYIDLVRAETQAYAAAAFTKKVQKYEEKVAERLSLAETKNQIRQEVYDKLLARLKADEVLSDDVLAKLARVGLEFTDEKPAQVQKRISEHTETHEIGGETLERLERMLSGAGYLAPLPALEAPRVIDVVVLSE